MAACARRARGSSTAVLLSRLYFGIQVLLLHLVSQAQWMDPKSSDGSNANALTPVLGDGEVVIRKRGIRKEILGYFLSQVKKWGFDGHIPL